MGAVLAGALQAIPVAAAERAQPELVRPVSRKLNTTGRAISMPVPMKDDALPLGEIMLRINADDTILIPKASLVDKLTPVLSAEALRLLHAAHESAGQLSLADLKAAGFDVRFDPAQLELVVLPNPDQRPSGDLSFHRQRGPLKSVNAAPPASFSGYFNVIGGIDYLWGQEQQDNRASGQLDVESVARMYGLVLENEFSIEGDVDTMTCPTGARCLYQHTAGPKRQHSRLVYDMPDDLLRLQIGDATTEGTGFQRSPDILGVMLEKSPRKLRPGESIRPTGRSSFRIERTSEIEVVINGSVVNRLRLRPGNYNLSDLPLSTGANEIELRITDDSGERRTLAFTTFFDGSLLAAGKEEWSLSGGMPSYFEDNERNYVSGDYFASGFYRYGLTNEATVEGHMQADNNVVMGGANVFTATAWGLFGLEGGVSGGSAGLGWAANLSWDLARLDGPARYFTGLPETLRLAAEYRSPGFRTPGDFLDTAGGILFPQYDYWLRLTGSYTVPIDAGIMAMLSARYQFAADEVPDLSTYRLTGDRYGVDLTFSSAITPWMNGSLGVGYSNETYLVTDLAPGEEGEFRIMARLSLRPDERTSVSASYDSLNKAATVSAYTSYGRGVDRWEATVDVQEHDSDQATAGGSLTYYGNRAEVTASHTSAFRELSWSDSGLTQADQRSSFRVGTSIAFADGKIGVGQPIRGDGFAVVSPHESIADKEITVGTADDVRARADAWGPAVVTDLPAYSNATLPVDVAGLPIGYSLGAGAIETYAPYHGGYAVEVGSAYSVSVYGTLSKADGEPVALLAGTASPADSPEKQVTLFTNAVGRFAAEGFAPGRWTIEMPTDEAPTRYVLDVPRGTDGLFKAGSLTPVKQE